MEATIMAAGTAFDGSAARTFDSSKLSSLIKNRGSRFKLNLAGYTMSQVLVAYEQFKKKISPNYRNGNTQHQIKRLEEYLGLTIMPEDICDDFYIEAFNFLSTVPNAEGKIVKPSTIKTYFTNLVASLSWASKHGCQIDPSYNVYKIASYEQPKVALTPCQISHIYHFDLNNKENRQKLIVARRTFITYWCNRDLSVVKIQKCSGHKDVKMISRYCIDMG